MMATYMYPSVQIYATLDVTNTKAELSVKILNAPVKLLAVIDNIEKRGIGSNSNWITVSIEVENRNLYTITKEWTGLVESITTDNNYLSSAFTTGTGAQILTFSKTVAADEEKPSGVIGS